MVTLLWILLAYGCYRVEWKLQLLDPDPALQVAVIQCGVSWQHWGTLIYLGIFWLLQGQQPEPETLLQAFEISALLLAAWLDHYVQNIPDMVYVPGFVSGTAWLIQQHPSVEVIVSLIVFVVMQAVIFRRLYGGSDCLAYSLCALYFAGAGGLLYDDLVFMLVTVGIETVVQIVHHNLDFRCGRLKKPVAVIPYMAVSMIWFLISRRLK